MRPPTTTAELGAYLDEVHAANPNLPLMITEFGAESVRDGPVTQPGSRQFQTRFMLEHLRIHASKPYVAGSIALGAARLPRGPDLDRRRAARLVDPALEQQEPDRGVRRAQAGLLRAAQALAQDAPAALATLRAP